ncbi:hypothetical protein HDU76_010163 [Blyttiomyces sp. JEL0837]|nr:hypothetical protein HDU76_010163 [Blyttiomyces sp. JEL0837]
MSAALPDDPAEAWAAVDHILQKPTAMEKLAREKDHRTVARYEPVFVWYFPPFLANEPEPAPFINRFTFVESSKASQTYPWETGN